MHYVWQKQQYISLSLSCLSLIAEENIGWKQKFNYCKRLTGFRYIFGKVIVCNHNDTFCHSILHIIQACILLGHMVFNYSPVFSSMHHNVQYWDHCMIYSDVCYHCYGKYSSRYLSTLVYSDQNTPDWHWIRN